MASGLMDEAVKELLKDVLKEVRDEQTKQDARQEELAKALQELSGKIVERVQEADKLGESFKQFQKDMEDTNGKSQAQLTGDVASMKERLDKFEDDSNGTGGLKQVHDKCTILEKTLSEIVPKEEDSQRLVKECYTRTEEFDRKLRELNRQSDDFTSTLKVSEERLTNMEGVVATIGTASEALEDSVSRKYEKLWEDVLHAIDEVKGTQLEAMKEDLNSQKEVSKTETRSMVTYALNFMATAHGERRQMAINKSLVTAWKEQTWNSSRRRLGISYLNKIFQRRRRVVFDTWHRGHDTSVLCDRLNGQYTEKLHDVFKEIKAGDAKLEKHCHKLDGEVVKLEREKATTAHVDTSVQQLRHTVQEELKAIDQIKVTLKDHDGVHKRHDDLHRRHTDMENDFEAKIQGLGEDIRLVIEGCKHYAKNTEVEGMIRDILLIWNSIKQLDTAKADKKDVDNFALETGNRDKLSQRHLEDLEADLDAKSKQTTLRSQEKWSELEGRMDESGRQFRHWEQMWEKLSGFVEDLVAKIGDSQGDNKPAATLRTAASRVGGGFNHPAAYPPVLPGKNSNNFDNSAATIDRGGHQHNEGLDTKMLWINSAKGIVDATLDQAVNNPIAPGRIRPLSSTRPKSASLQGRKPHDRMTGSR